MVNDEGLKRQPPSSEIFSVVPVVILPAKAVVPVVHSKAVVCVVAAKLWGRPSFVTVAWLKREPPSAGIRNFNRGREILADGDLNIQNELSTKETQPNQTTSWTGTPINRYGCRYFCSRNDQVGFDTVTNSPTWKDAGEVVGAFQIAY